LEDLTAQDIMQKDVVTIGPDATVRELAELMAAHKISGVPVVDAQGLLLGDVSEGDVILQDADLHFPHYVQIFESVIYLESVRKFEERFKKAFGAKVADVMSTEVVTVEPSATAREVATLMADRDVNRVPVVAGGRVVGIITRGDLVRAMALGSTE
jgi:CBS domain-containing protein